MTERFRKAYDSLVRAFFEGTLAKGTCIACACGNIIFDAVGEPVTKQDLEIHILEENEHLVRHKLRRADELWGNFREVSGSLNNMMYGARAKTENMINVAGYTAKEFARIEQAFETNTSISYRYYPHRSQEDILEDQYRGLCAVVDVLMELDNINEKADEYKNKFREHAGLATV